MRPYAFSRSIPKIPCMTPPFLAWSISPPRSSWSRFSFCASKPSVGMSIPCGSSLGWGRNCVGMAPRDSVVCAAISSAHVLTSRTSNGAASGVPHPSCLGSSFFRMSLISSSMISVSANFKRGSAHAIGLSLRLVSGSSPGAGFAHPSSSATILTSCPKPDGIVTN